MDTPRKSNTRKPTPEEVEEYQRQLKIEMRAKVKDYRDNTICIDVPRTYGAGE